MCRSQHGRCSTCRTPAKLLKDERLHARCPPHPAADMNHRYFIKFLFGIQLHRSTTSWWFDTARLLVVRRSVEHRLLNNPVLQLLLQEDQKSRRSRRKSPRGKGAEITNLWRLDVESRSGLRIAQTIRSRQCRTSCPHAHMQLDGRLCLPPIITPETP